ncbi:hypothetical protein EG329_003101 [Mollisiaceae sp. DMI_Dod_QoI]|nr:hypothetical protein EG329_003101 [Helotiales sp. DMI_Dod_QoI]
MASDPITSSTTTLSLQPPPGTLLQSYNLSLPALSPLQSPTIPQTLKDSFSVRENVFVNEQRAVPLQHHIDSDDARSYHWLLYSNQSLNSPHIPIGTVRLVPPPHYPHPEPGARFEAPHQDVPAPDPKILFNTPLPPHVVDRKTSLHDGIEPYVKLGRLSVVKEYRGKKFADLLIQEALGWAKKKENRGLFSGGEEEREWKGLVCIHAQEGAVKAWERNGFIVDEGMGTWFEGGIRHTPPAD